MLNVYNNQQNWQTGSSNPMDPKTLPTLHIDIPHDGKRFWIRQIPTSCLPT
jgi:hypothetical protein